MSCCDGLSLLQVDLSVNADNCGVCGNRCVAPGFANATCSAGVCGGASSQCAAGLTFGCSGVAQVAIASSFTCLLLKQGGKVACFQSNGEDPSRWKVPADLGPASSISAGVNVACAVMQLDGSIRCWGADTTNYFGVVRNVPSRLQGVKQVAVGGTYACALLGNGSATCWGNVNTTMLAGLSDLNVTSIAPGITYLPHNLCVVTQNGSVSCWPITGVMPYYTDPVDVGPEHTAPADLLNVTAVGVGYWHACAIVNSTVRCFGRPDLSGGASSPPANLTDVTSIAVSFYHTCALRRNGQVVCWGCDPSQDMSFGQCTPPPGLNATSIAVGRYSTYAVRQDGQVALFGHVGHYDYSVSPPKMILFNGNVSWPDRCLAC